MQQMTKVCSCCACWTRPSLSDNQKSLTMSACQRRVVEEAAWAYRHRPSVGVKLRRWQAHVSERIEEIASKAQQRLHERYRKLLAKGKNKGVVMTAVGRELLGFIWAIGIQVEGAQKEPLQRVA
jgi:transposase